MAEIWNLFLFHPLVNGLILLYKFFGNLGVAIIILTLAIRAVLIPLTAPSLKAAKKMAELAPEIEKLKKRHGGDKQKFAQAQMELYRQKGVNPAAGCLPQIIQLLILIALYQAFAQVLRANGVEIISRLNEILYPALRLPLETKINLSFLYLDLSKPDVFHFQGLPLPGIFLIFAALTQFLSSKMMQPALRKEEKEAQKTPEKTDDVATAMQSQMLYLFPLMTILIGFTFPSGLILYWFIFSAFQLVQQYFTSGWGGLSPWVAKLKVKNEK
ncbi:MAG: YidC/Oxa1 family membrane protein insertase [Patescibacteria group bacterium]